ncbi:MAG: hypothetical protein ACKVRN_14075 [Pyrinomonadaceae bacterium]
MTERIRRGFIRVNPIPGLRDGPNSFKNMNEYRKWAHENVPREYGFRVIDPPADWKQFDDEDEDYYIIPT